jgi:hypothetical protein
VSNLLQSEFTMPGVEPGPTTVKKKRRLFPGNTPTLPNFLSLPTPTHEVTFAPLRRAGILTSFPFEDLPVNLR